MKAGFQGIPAMRRMGWQDWRDKLVEPLVFVSEAGFTYTVPAGFVTDYASIPQIFWNLPGFFPEGPAAIPAVLHDWLYSLRGGDPYYLSRKACDDLFLEAMVSVGVGFVTRTLTYQGVRQFGWAWSLKPAWRKDVFGA